MTHKYLPSIAFVLGLAAIAWVALSYAHSSAWMLLVLALITAAFVFGALELRRYRRDTAALGAALDGLSAAPESLQGWLAQLPASLRNVVAMRVDGARTGLPAPVMSSALSGLLVLLGMLGTLLGMMSTLRGTGIALETATDLQAVRDALAAPVKGLGFAFGTSIAGIATSAMLGLMATLARRDRQAVAQRLDAAIAGPLHGFTHAERRDQTYRVLQEQASYMPALVQRLEYMAQALEQQGRASSESLDARQQEFHARTEAAYLKLAGSVEQSLRDSIAGGAEAASRALQPMLQSTMGQIAEATRALQASLAETVHQHVQQSSAGLQESTARISATWTQALEEHRQASQSLAQELNQALQRLGDGFDQRSKDMIDGLASRLDGSVAAISAGWDAAAQRQQAQQQQAIEAQQQGLQAAAAAFEQQAAATLRAISEAQAAVQASQQAVVEGNRDALLALAGGFEQQAQGVLAALREAHAALQATQQAQLAEHQQALATVAGGFERQAQALLAQVRESHAGLQQAQQQHVEANREALAGVVDGFQQHSQALLAGMAEAQGKLQQALAEQDQQRLSAWTASLSELGAALREEWQQLGQANAQEQKQAYAAISEAAQAAAEQARVHGSQTIAEVGRLVEVATEAPRAAAEVVESLRQSLSDSMVRDTAMLAERNQLMETLSTLLQAVNHASTEQKAAIDALVGTSADLLERIGSRFSEQVQAGTGKLDELATRVGAGAAEVASLGEAFGAAVEAFGQVNERLSERLERIEGALEKSLARSDEQLAYYVAQAREVIDLSLLAQKQIVEDMRQLADARSTGQAA